MRNEIFLSLLLGFLLDCLVGDPHSIPHPVVLIGKLISALEKGLRKLFPKTRAGEMTAGGILWVLTVAVSFWVPLGLLYLCGQPLAAAGGQLRDVLAGPGGQESENREHEGLYRPENRND